ncbi:MAG: biotin/lipoyl-binding protein, partial [Betaproteobacteria bacterium]|nr:biotin/lipoyl-binding protein [Betaproteobacteria bacterium]
VCSSFELAHNKGLHVRVDDGVREDDSISPFYDSMVAKLIVHGDTREKALALLDEALAQTRIVGLTTNVQFLRYVVRSDAFANAKLDTALIQREEKVLFNQEPIGLALAAAAVVANTLQAEKKLEGYDPFSRRDGWKVYGNTTRPFGFVFQGESHHAVLTYLHDGALHLKIAAHEGLLSWRVGESDNGFASNNTNYNSNTNGAHAKNTNTLTITFGTQHIQAQVFHHAEGLDDVAHVFAPQGATRITVVDALAHAGEVQEAGGRLTAPMPGKVVSFAVKSGDKVKAGQALAVMEAMKMEHTIAAPADGEVLELLYAPGDQVAEGEELLKLKV